MVIAVRSDFVRTGNLAYQFRVVQREVGGGEESGRDLVRLQQAQHGPQTRFRNVHLLVHGKVFAVFQGCVKFLHVKAEDGFVGHGIKPSDEIVVQGFQRVGIRRVFPDAQ